MKKVNKFIWRPNLGFRDSWFRGSFVVGLVFGWVAKLGPAFLTRFALFMAVSHFLMNFLDLVLDRKTQ